MLKRAVAEEKIAFNQLTGFGKKTGMPPGKEGRVRYLEPDRLRIACRARILARMVAANRCIVDSYVASVWGWPGFKFIASNTRYGC